MCDKVYANIILTSVHRKYRRFCISYTLRKNCRDCILITESREFYGKKQNKNRTDQTS